MIVLFLFVAVVIVLILRELIRRLRPRQLIRKLIAPKRTW